MFQRLLERIAAALETAGFPYMIIGGQAVLLYGEPRLTKDIDVTVGADLDRLEELLACMTGLGLQPLVDPKTFTRETLVLPCQDPESGIRIDVVFTFSPYGQQAIGRSRSVKIGSANVHFASLEDLIIHKVIAGRPRDIEDVSKLLLMNPDADTGYIERWLREFDTALAEPFLQRFRDLRDSSG